MDMIQREVLRSRGAALSNLLDKLFVKKELAAPSATRRRGRAVLGPAPIPKRGRDPTLNAPPSLWFSPDSVSDKK